MSFRSTLIAASPLPYKRRLQYIQSTGTQYIDTGIIPTPNTKVEVKYGESCGTWAGGLIKAIDDSQSPSAVFGFQSPYTSTPNSALYVNFPFASSAVDIGVDYQRGRVHVVTLDKYSATFDGVATPLSGASSWSMATSLYLFTSHYYSHDPSAGSFYLGEIYHCKIWQGNVLVRDIIPVLDFNDVACMYNQVTGQFLYNAGSGTFLYA